MTDSIDRRLYAHATPPPHLARRVARSLRQRALLRRRFSAAPTGLALLAAAACFGLGVVAGRWQTPPLAPPAVDRYVLLLYVDEAFTTATAGHELVGEYREWAGRLRAKGRLELGERLEPAEWIIGRVPGEAGTRLAGMFIIQAPTESEAMAIARDAPHARHGGTIVIRRVAPT
ncbi:MAG: YciI family protein [Gemmatimonadales bacterium]